MSGCVLIPNPNPNPLAQHAVSMDVSETWFDVHSYKTENTDMDFGNPTGELTYEK